MFSHCGVTASKEVKKPITWIYTNEFWAVAFIRYTVKHDTHAISKRIGVKYKKKKKKTTIIET